MEDATRQPDLAKSVQKYQLAVDQAKVTLDLAMCESRARCTRQDNLPLAQLY